jgi:hypothetical protein
MVKIQARRMILNTTTTLQCCLKLIPPAPPLNSSLPLLLNIVGSVSFVMLFLILSVAFLAKCLPAVFRYIESEFFILSAFTAQFLHAAI